VGKTLDVTLTEEWDKLVRPPSSVVDLILRVAHIISLNPWHHFTKATRAVPLFTDASPGGGAFVKRCGAGGPLLPSWWAWSHRYPSSEMFHLELISVVPALESILRENLNSAAQGPSHERIGANLFSDNSGVVSVVNSGLGRDPCTAAILRYIYHLNTYCSMEVRGFWIPTQWNPADIPSRVFCPDTPPNQKGSHIFSLEDLRAISNIN